MKENRVYAVTLMPHELIFPAEYGMDLHTVIHSMIHESRYKTGYLSPCGGSGTCGKCRIRIESGMASPLDLNEEQMLSDEDIISGIRLACHVQVEGDIIISEIDEHREMSIETVFMSGEGILPGKRFVESIRVTCCVPDPEDNYDISERVTASVMDQCSLKSRDLSSDILNRLAFVNRKLIDEKNPFDIWVHVCEGEISGICLAEEIDGFYGIAVDIGTTTIACYLIELETGRIAGTESELNSQYTAGADVITRIGYTMNNREGSRVLADRVVEQIQEMSLKLCKEYMVSSDRITSCAIAGNTTMMHLLLGVDAGTISRYPFNPVFTGSKVLKSFFSELRNCSVYLLPAASAYIGADIVGGSAAVHLDSSPETALFVDIGTNGEIVLKTDSSLYACSTAAGPAFEGANLSCGAGGVSGVIDSAAFDGDRMICTTIDETTPVAVCGSGVLDVTSLLLSEGLIDERGKFTELNHPLSERIIRVNGKKAFALYEDSVYLTQPDIREIQLAKSAIRTGIDALIEETGIAVDNIYRLYIGGGFGSRIRISSAVNIGLIPEELENRVTCVGNSSGRGAAGALLDKSFRERCDMIREKIDVVDLSGRKSFKHELMKNMYFKVNRTCKEVERVE